MKNQVALRQNHNMLIISNFFFLLVWQNLKDLIYWCWSTLNKFLFLSVIVNAIKELYIFCNHYVSWSCQQVLTVNCWVGDSSPSRYNILEPNLLLRRATVQEMQTLPKMLYIRTFRSVTYTKHLPPEMAATHKRFLLPLLSLSAASSLHGPVPFWAR